MQVAWIHSRVPLPSASGKGMQLKACQAPFSQHAPWEGVVHEHHPYLFTSLPSFKTTSPGEKPLGILTQKRNNIQVPQPFSSICKMSAYMHTHTHTYWFWLFCISYWMAFFFLRHPNSAFNQLILPLRGIIILKGPQHSWLAPSKVSEKGAELWRAELEPFPSEAVTLAKSGTLGSVGFPCSCYLQK